MSHYSKLNKNNIHLLVFCNKIVFHNRVIIMSLITSSLGTSVNHGFKLINEIT